jgi:hypothetical protein
LCSLLAGVLFLGEGGVPFTEEAQACTRMGCSSGVGVKLERLPRKTARVRVCTQDRCRRADKVGALSGPDYYVADIRFREECEARDGRVIRVWIRVFNRAGKVIRQARGRGKLHSYQPNGPDCPPTCYFVGFEYFGDTGELEVAWPRRPSPAEPVRR